MIGKQVIGKKVLAEELVLPAAVLYHERIINNIRWMQTYADQCGVRLAPHGKTSMIPALFKLQVQAGAWGMTLATVEQVAAAYENGIRRILLANQLVGKANMAVISNILEKGDAEIYCLVDSVENVAVLDGYFGARKQSLKVLIELGVVGGRCGCRTEEQVNALQQEVDRSTSLQLSGIEFYEGVVHNEHAEQTINDFVSWAISICQTLMDKDAFDTEKVILTGAGSAWYDLVAEALAAADFQGIRGSSGAQVKEVVPLLRPGCYLIQDQGIYHNAQARVLKRSQVACDIGGDLMSSLEVWAYVLSIPEPGKAIIGMGKRNVAFDSGLPMPILSYRQGWKEPRETGLNCYIRELMDQHAYLDFSSEIDLAVGDMIGFSTSHPCLTLDKWKNIYMVDNELKVLEEMATFFHWDQPQ